jgi:hypothetical protein
MSSSAGQVLFAGKSQNAAYNPILRDILTLISNTLYFWEKDPLARTHIDYLVILRPAASSSQKRGFFPGYQALHLPRHPDCGYASPPYR